MNRRDFLKGLGLAALSGVGILPRVEEKAERKDFDLHCRTYESYCHYIRLYPRDFPGDAKRLREVKGYRDRCKEEMIELHGAHAIRWLNARV